MSYVEKGAAYLLAIDRKQCRFVSAEFHDDRSRNVGGNDGH